MSSSNQKDLLRKYTAFLNKNAKNKEWTHTFILVNTKTDPNTGEKVKSDVIAYFKDKDTRDKVKAMPSSEIPNAIKTYGINGLNMMYGEDTLLNKFPEIFDDLKQRYQGHKEEEEEASAESESEDSASESESEDDKPVRKAPSKVKKVTSESNKSIHSSDELKNLTVEQIIEVMIDKFGANWQRIAVCIVNQLNSTPDIKIDEYTKQQLRDFVKMIPQKNDVQTTEQDDEEEESDAEEESDTEEIVTKMKAVKLSPKHSPKQVSPKRSPKRASPKKAEGPSEDNIKIIKVLINQFNLAMEDKQKEKANKIKARISSLKDEFGLTDEYLENNLYYYGFGRHSLQSNRSKKKGSKRGSKRVSKRGSKRRSRFGKIYGLQNGPGWTGVYPMSLNVEGTLPNLNNVVRNFRAFGKKRSRSLNKKLPKRGSRRGSRRGSKKVSKRVSRRGSKKVSKRVSKRGSKRRSKKKFGFTPPMPRTFV